MLHTHDIAAYALALLIAAAVPGPGITSLVARSSVQGPIAGAAMTAGLILGDLVYLTLAVFGLSLIVAHFSGVFVAIRFLSVGYLLYLAWQFWHFTPQASLTSSLDRRTLLAAGISGLTITLSNPKPIAFYLALMPLVLDLDQITFTIWAGILVPTTVLVLLSVGGFYVAGATVLRRWLTQPSAQLWLNRCAAITMAGAALSMIINFISTET